jgi:hypothetical protein
MSSAGRTLRVHRPCCPFRLKRSVKPCHCPQTLPPGYDVRFAATAGFPLPRSTTAVPRIPLVTASEPLELEIPEGTLVTECAGPPGVEGDAAIGLVAEAIASPGHGPPLAAHVVPGDRVVIAIAGSIPCPDAVVAAVTRCLDDAGIEPTDLSVLAAAPLEAAPGPSLPATAALPRFDPTVESATAYLAADADAKPLYLSRQLVDADVVVGVGGFGWDASLGGRSPEGELWPSFGRIENRHQLAAAIARRGRGGLLDWRSAVHDITWQLGVCASLRLVAGRLGSLHAAVFGLPEEATRLARTAAAGWRPPIEEPADLTVATLSGNAGGLAAAIRAIAAAARATHPEGTICLVGPIAETPGVVLTRWRQGAPLAALIKEAIGSRDPGLVADAAHTRQLARVLGDRRLVLQCGLDVATVEDLGFGHAADVAVVERLAARADQVVILHEADLMLPRH